MEKALNGMKLACNGNHPTWIHQKVIDRLEKDEPGRILSKDLIKFVHEEMDLHGAIGRTRQDNWGPRGASDACYAAHGV